MVDKDERRKEITAYIGEEASCFYSQMIDDMLFLEEQLIRLKEYPFIKVHPDDPTKQKPTPAARQYKELLQQYTNIVKVLEHLTPDSGNGEDSPLRSYVGSRRGENG